MNKKQTKIIVTTSWDDGHKLDLRVAKLLKKYGLKGTFYISPNNREFSKSMLLTDKEVKALSIDFEIGAHTMTHPLLANTLDTMFFKVVTKILKTLKRQKYRISPAVNLKEANWEIKESKKYLEKLLKKKIVSFCYPAGSQNSEVQKLVKKNGFKYARTVERHRLDLGKNPYASPTTLHAYTQYQDIFKILRFSGWNLKEFSENLDWENLAKRMFDRLKPGDTFHFWGHSWIIDANDEWDKLERVFAHISKNPHCKYVENRNLL